MKRYTRLIDAVFLIALMLFVLAGVKITPFHGDEPMQIYMSRDYETALMDGNPSALMTQPPYFIDDDPQLRILNGSVNRYLIGLSRQIAGIPREQLPPRPGWDWGLDYNRNVETGHLPSDALMLAGRLSSALLLAFSVPLMFALANLVGGRKTAYLAALIYTLNPIILLNGRRAVQEGALLFFGVLVVLTAAVIAKRRLKNQPVWFLWIALAAAGALALASKHSSLPFVIGALAWVFLAELTHFKPRSIATTCAALVLCAVVMIGGFIALSPALWNDPPARLADLLVVRQELLDIQVSLSPDGATTIGQRVSAIITQPFAAPPQFFEVDTWASFEPITAQINAYLSSPLSGYATGGVLGLFLTLAMMAGGVILFIPRLRPNRDWGTTLGIAAWIGALAASLLVNPLDWQRYYLGLIPAAGLLAAVGLTTLINQIVLRLDHSSDNHRPKDTP
jgi:4-amino-4-deoxy-L-arabinose transferase-like glycosyltransferase